MTRVPCLFHQAGTRREPGGEPEEPSADHRAVLPGHYWFLQRVPTTAAQCLPLSLPGMLPTPPPKSPMAPPQAAPSASLLLLVCHISSSCLSTVRSPDAFQITALFITNISPQLYLTYQPLPFFWNKTSRPICFIIFYFCHTREHKALP